MLAPSSPLSAVSLDYLDALERQYRANPASIDPGWRCVFDVLRELQPVESERSRAGMEAAIAAAYRDRGHLAARLDPLGVTQPASPADLLPPQIVRLARLEGIAACPWGDAALVERLRSIYGGTLAVETAHIDEVSLRAWVHNVVEGPNQVPSSEARRRALELLTAAEEFERFMAVKFPAKKRFGAEGAETLVPLLDRLLRDSAAAGVTDVLIGSMHRGRLNVTANVLDKPLAQLFAEFKGAYPFTAEPLLAADVPYHLGFESELVVEGRPLRVTLASNPSHLEAVKPVVLGRVRARQDLTDEPQRVLGILVHTDASVAAQGIVGETLQLSGIAGFTTGGTIHVIVNNQIGFTTDMDEARSSRYCTGPWKAVDSLVLHANGDDPDAALRAADLAFAFRQTHRRDAVIDLVCYRRNGHNEIDEPRFTHPLTYRVIDDHPAVASLFASRLAGNGIASAAEVETFLAVTRTKLQEGFEGADSYRPNRSGFSDSPEAARDSAAPKVAAPETGVPLERLRELLAALSSVPKGLALDRKVDRIVRQRATGADATIPWALGEALAFATLLAEGTAIRLSGQDVVRGAFSHRHFALTDIETGRRHISLNHLGIPQAEFEVINSPLSEYAVLGFEYGYSLERPDALVIWEAQFGDFANGAQIIIDQFVASGEEKWRQPSRLVMLLPHGLEGQGPEHSSARLERFLQLAAQDNLRIAQPSTPANYFHLLRNQVHRGSCKPLVVMTPKSLLRLPAAVSPIERFAAGTAFQPVLVSLPSAPIRSVLMCSGKIAYDLERERDVRGTGDIAILRLEQLYPLPSDVLLRVFKDCGEARFTWVQEEPLNMGAWSFLDRRLEVLLEQAGAQHSRVSCISRPESPSPAGSFHGHHDRDQRHLVEEALQHATRRIEEKCLT